MEVQKPNKDRESKEQQLRKKTLETAAVPNKPSPVLVRLQTPPHPTSPSLPQPFGPQEEGAGELRMDGEGGGEEQEGAKPPSAALGSATAAAAAKAATAEEECIVTDLQKKLRRAERFGMPVKISEEEKRNSRAERFGTVSTLPGKSEEQKRKTRAERFGVAGHSTADEEAKKKARLARFAQDSKPDNLEEEKRNARAIRFSQTTSSAPSQTNGKANSEPKTPAVDKTKEGF